jgi:hypothetical protein
MPLHDHGFNRTNSPVAHLATCFPAAPSVSAESIRIALSRSYRFQTDERTVWRGHRLHIDRKPRATGTVQRATLTRFECVRGTPS